MNTFCHVKLVARSAFRAATMDKGRADLEVDLLKLSWLEVALLASEDHTAAVCHSHRLPDRVLGCPVAVSCQVILYPHTKTGQRGARVSWTPATVRSPRNSGPALLSLPCYFCFPQTELVAVSAVLRQGPAVMNTLRAHFERTLRTLKALCEHFLLSSHDIHLWL